jgi:hypothetical protein
MDTDQSMEGPCVSTIPPGVCHRAALFPLITVLGTSALTACGCATVARHEMYSPPSCPAGVVFVADGSGNLRGTFDSLSKAVADEGVPLCVERVDWSHGTCRILSDLHGRSHQRAKGHDLAGQIIAFRQTHPGGRVCLIGHSTGAAIVLAAAESLPSGSVNRIVLLAPAVSPSYDLRPALACSCEGIDSFHSGRDCLSFLLAAVGTADGSWVRSAGRDGFQPVSHGPEDDRLYERLRQHPWQWDFVGVGNQGGHFGWTGYECVRTCVLPLLVSSPPIRR